MPRENATESPGQCPAPPSRKRLGYAAAFAAALLLYLVSMAPGVVWQDSGLAQVRVLQRDIVGSLGLALSHPLYYVLAIAAQALPLAESAFKTNLISVLFGALTIANVYLLLRLATGRRRGAVIGAASLAVAHTFWQHCALAEVYTVSTALLSAELLCVYMYASAGKSRWLVLLFLLNGLGVSNHMLAVLSLACYTPLVAWLLWRRAVKASLIPVLALVWIAGASLYLALIIAQLAGGADVGVTIRSALFGSSWAGNVLNATPGFRQLLNSTLYLGLNFPTPAALFLIPGAIAVYRLRLGLLRSAVFALIAVHLIWAIRYDVPDQYTFFIPSIVLLAIMIGFGADRFLERRTRGWNAALIVLAVFPAAVYVATPALTRALNVNLGVSREVPYRDARAYFLRPWKTGYQGAERFARELKETLPENAVLLADGTTVRPIHYLQLTGRWRDDIRVFPPPRRADEPVVDASPELLADDLARLNVFVVTPQRGYCPGWLLDEYEFVPDGIVYRVVGRSADH